MCQVKYMVKLNRLPGAPRAYPRTAARRPAACVVDYVLSLCRLPGAPRAYPRTVAIGVLRVKSIAAMGRLHGLTDQGLRADAAWCQPGLMCTVPGTPWASAWYSQGFCRILSGLWCQVLPGLRRTCVPDALWACASCQILSAVVPGTPRAFIRLGRSRGVPASTANS